MNPEPVRKRFVRPVPVHGVYPWGMTVTCGNMGTGVIAPGFLSLSVGCAG